MSKAEAKVEELVGMIERGQLRLPEMQRQYVWQATRVRDLMDSLYRGYPSGAILLWETAESVPMRQFAVEQEPSPYKTTKLLLDGQQRLTSLSAVLRGKPITVRSRKRPIDLLFNLEHPDELEFVTEVNEEAEDPDDKETADASEDDLQARLHQLTFVVGTRRLAAMPNWVSVSQVMTTSSDAPFLRKAGVKSFEDPRYDKYTERLKRLRGIKEYSYRMDVLEASMSYDEVTEIFVRVNSLGAKLRSSDLAMAQITAKWRESLKVFEEFQQECADAGFDMDLGVHVRNLVSFATGQSRFKTVGRLTVAELQKSWNACKDGMRFAINFLKSNLRISCPALLSSPSLMISLGYAGHQLRYKLSPQEEADLRYWLLVANTKGRYSRGSSETLLDQDLNRLRNKDGIEAIIESLRLQFGKLEIEPGELEGRNARSAYFKTMFLAFSQDGAKDWVSNLAISLSHKGKQHLLQFHHIFPRAILKGQYKPVVINDIANLSFIGGKTNRSISSKSPHAYFPTIVSKQGNKPFAAQCIPTDPEHLTADNYANFLSERRKLIAERLNRFLSESRSIA